jgi:hypothetical protein
MFYGLFSFSANVYNLLCMRIFTVVSDCGFTRAGSHSKSPVIIRSEIDQSHRLFCSGHVARSRLQNVGLCKTVAYLRVGVKPQSLTTVPQRYSSTVQYCTEKLDLSCRSHRNHRNHRCHCCHCCHRCRRYNRCQIVY